jgi:hypothetical protein
VAARTSEQEGISKRPAGEPGLELISDEDEIMHLVCCRDTTWAVALCGEPSDHINLAGTVACTMCVDVAEQLRPGCLSQDPLICPKDGKPCPDEHEIDLRILREVTS